MELIEKGYTDAHTESASENPYYKPDVSIEEVTRKESPM